MHKIGAEQLLEGNGYFHQEYSDQWEILADKGYQGDASYCRAVLPIKKTMKKSLALQEEVFNKKVSSDRIIVKNFFGRMCVLWNVM